MVNRSVKWADWDIELLAAEFGDLKALDFDLTLTGFDAREIDAFTLQPNAAEDEVPPVPETPRNGSPWKSTLPRLSAPRSIWGNMNRKY
jgi:hypothetical protein